jgi:hypothetical protein
MLLRLLALLSCLVLRQASNSCIAVGAGHLTATWDAVPDAKLYEIHFGLNGTEYGSQTSAINSAVVIGLKASTSYHFRVRASTVNEVSGWLDWSPSGWECTTAASGLMSRATGSKPSPATNFVNVYRVSEHQLAGQSEVDFLMNHDCGSADGDVAFLTGACGGNASHFVHSFNESLITSYCVEYAANSLTDCPDPNGCYGPCNPPTWAFGDAAPMPNMTYTCKCNNNFDRRVAHMKVSEACDTSRPHKDCNCTDASLAHTHKYIGEMPVFLPWLCGSMSDSDGICDVNIPFGSWYSAPAAGQCAEGADVGDNGCTWKRHQRANFLYGRKLVELGWNSTKPNWADKNDTSQYQHNLEVFKAGFQGITRTACGALE